MKVLAAAQLSVDAVSQLKITKKAKNPLYTPS